MKVEIVVSFVYMTKTLILFTYSSGLIFLLNKLNSLVRLLWWVGNVDFLGDFELMDGLRMIGHFWCFLWMVFLRLLSEWK